MCFNIIVVTPMSTYVTLFDIGELFSEITESSFITCKIS